MSNPFSLPWSIINRFRTYGVDLRAESPRLDSPGVGGFGQTGGWKRVMIFELLQRCLWHVPKNHHRK
jgi:hypothetical protein